MSLLISLAGPGTLSCTSTDDGVSWVPHTLPSNNSWSGMAYSPSTCIAIANGTANAASTTTGLVWTARTMPASKQWIAIAWNGTVFCAIAANSNYAATSPDGITWTARTLPSISTWGAIAWNGTVFCALADGTAATSPDGITWTTRTISAGFWHNVIWNGTVFCAIAGSINYVATSPDGITWTDRTLPVTDYWAAVAWNGTVFCAIAGSSNAAATSPDGITWTARTNYSAAQWRVITNSTLPPVILGDITDTCNSTTSIAYTTSITLNESISISLSELLKSIDIIIEYMQIAANSIDLTINKSIINEYINSIDNLAIILNGLINESIDNTDTLSVLLKQTGEVLESISVLSALTNKYIINETILNVLNILDAVLNSKAVAVSEVLNLIDTLIEINKSYNLIIDSISKSDTLSSLFIKIGIISESSISTDTLSNKAIFLNGLSDNFIISIPSLIEQETYLAYLLAPETNSVSTYNNYNFNMCTKFDYKYLFANTSGLYEYGGTTDNGSKIIADFETIAYNFGTSNLKQVPAVYLGITNSDKFILKVKVDGKAEVLYTLNKHTNGLGTQKVNIGKGLIGRYFQFEIITDANDFNLESIEFFPVVLKRKL